ncbi:MAG TPA: hypothetical protein VID19_05505 [Candidatus Eremiobacteraceae bacterium]
MNRWRSSAGLLLAAGLALSGCSSVANRIAGFGQHGFARLIVASPTTVTTGIALEADGGVINSGLSTTTPIGVYSNVGATSIKFDVNTGAGTQDLVPAINVSVAPSTNYSIVLEGEPGASNYIAFGFQDTNALNNAATVRFKVNHAAPNVVGPIDVYVWLSTTSIPGTPTVPGMLLNQDSGSVANAPGNAYIPQQGSNSTLPAGIYQIAIVPAGTVPNGSSDMFDGSTSFVLNTSYSLTIQDVDATPNHINVLTSIDEPFQGSNQTAVARHPLHVHPR